MQSLGAGGEAGAEWALQDSNLGPTDYEVVEATLQQIARERNTPRIQGFAPGTLVWCSPLWSAVQLHFRYSEPS
jgi:hypothetical protein